ncbi:transposase [Cucumis melo var. makuwa]|uniref:Transposase n=1 Tax=Cucumis melo var. makuwa TaxID=1194695 RepID=A0A5A7VA85_CUCMM|nr:transposase [Cucumis melo var. makuwa]
MKVRGTIHGEKVVVLIDCGATHNYGVILGYGAAVKGKRVGEGKISKWSPHRRSFPPQPLSLDGLPTTPPPRHLSSLNELFKLLVTPHLLGCPGSMNWEWKRSFNLVFVMPKAYTNEETVDDDLFHVINMVQNVRDQFSEVPNTFDNMFDDAKKPLYLGCKRFTKLSALVRLYNLKVRFGWSNASFSELLATISELLPENNKMLISIKDLVDISRCPKCNISRWKTSKNSNEEIKGVAAKQLWYFPIVPRLVDHLWPDFGSEPRNLRLGLSTDGINAYGDLSTKYSCWPVIATIYNLPPWLCMRRKYLMLTMLISGPKQPGYDINVYLAPLIDDLKLMWEEGVQCFDAHRNERFTLRAVLLWTINDFPAYGNLCGCSVKGYKACPNVGTLQEIWPLMSV